ncbi:MULTISPECIES: transposon-encoded TnpW family protein [Clostridia]|uniref:transposon-encoded TnpW family protein n=1 Tax=Clostridia TaxID=186801 RepID=UPI0022E1FA4A|nr:MULTISPECIES: transposon-encoded TnpW family protein [Clostridia]MDD7511007.1 transposon-encoded TnpW family protein [Peptostreptococcaceae bacterium]MDY5436028.1 transposon-encoded TnpW family protein [Peptostreptococcus porci]
MVENEKAQSSEMQTKEERNTPLKPDGILTKKMNGKTFVTEIYFDPNSKDTFQDKLLKVVQSERRE